MAARLTRKCLCGNRFAPGKWRISATLREQFVITLLHLLRGPHSPFSKLSFRAGLGGFAVFKGGSQMTLNTRSLRRRAGFMGSNGE